MKLLDNKTPQVEFDNIHTWIISLVFNNKAELVQVNGYGAIASNYEAENKFYIVCFKSVPYTLQ